MAHGMAEHIVITAAPKNWQMYTEIFCPKICLPKNLNTASKSCHLRGLRTKMLNQVNLWKKENNYSAQSFAQNLEREIKTSEQKLD